MRAEAGPARGSSERATHSQTLAPSRAGRATGGHRHSMHANRRSSTRLAHSVSWAKGSRHPRALAGSRLPVVPPSDSVVAPSPETGVPYSFDSTVHCPSPSVALFGSPRSVGAGELPRQVSRPATSLPATVGPGLNVTVNKPETVLP